MNLGAAGWEGQKGRKQEENMKGKKQKETICFYAFWKEVSCLKVILKCFWRVGCLKVIICVFVLTEIAKDADFL